MKPENIELAALALVPSVGHGGGIERYWKGVVEVLVTSGAEVEVLPILDATSSVPTLTRKLRFALRALARAKSLRRKNPVVILIFHPALAPLGGLIWAVAGGRRVHAKVFFYGLEAWRLGAISQWWIRRWGAGLVAISGFTAGSIVTVGNASRLAPGLEPDWYSLLTTPRAAASSTDPLPILSVFRMPAADEKGARVLLRAVQQVLEQRNDFTLTLAGHGPAPSWLRTFVRAHCTVLRLIEDPSAEELAELYRSSGLFVLATRTTLAGASGEGFGIVLLEAQLAQVPVVAPAFGGSDDALVDGVTGFRLLDESPDTLARILLWCLDHRAELSEMGENARTWAMATAAPDRFAASVRSILTDAAHPLRLPLRVVNGEESPSETLT